MYRNRKTSGFTLVEIMVVMILLSVIVLGLMAMFNQTQRAFRAGMAQTDQMEGGRMFNDLAGSALPELLERRLAAFSEPGRRLELAVLHGAFRARLAELGIRDRSGSHQDPHSSQTHAHRRGTHDDQSRRPFLRAR